MLPQKQVQLLWISEGLAQKSWPWHLSSAPNLHPSSPVSQDELLRGWDTEDPLSSLRTGVLWTWSQDSLTVQAGVRIPPRLPLRRGRRWGLHTYISCSVGTQSTLLFME